MAEIAGTVIAIPQILSGAWSVLKAAYNLYGSVDLRRNQIRILLDRASNLITQIAQHLSREEQGPPSSRMQENVNELQRICEDLKGLLEKLKLKGFLWCMMYTDKIDTTINDIQYQIINVFEMFNFACHLDRDNFQVEMRQARYNDQSELMKKLDDLSSNDEKILNAIQDQGGMQKRIEELLIAVLKRVEGRASDRSPETEFLRSIGSLLQQRSKNKPQRISQDWIVTSFEVDFDVVDCIGQGSFGKVFIGQWNAARVAIKQMYADDARTLTDKDRKAMYKEVKIWTKLHHPNILNLYGACLEGSPPFFVMQYCPFGNIRNYLRAHPDANRLNLCHDIVAGMSYLHNQNIIHTDLKGANILVDNQRNAVVSDFGLSLTIDGIRSLSSLTRAAGPRGTLRWMAPECLDGDSPTKASDVYSLGVTIWEIYKGENPFPAIADRLIVSHVVDRQRRPDRPPLLIEDTVWELVQKCWSTMPDFRPSMTSIQRSLESYSTRLGPEPSPSQHLLRATSETTYTLSTLQASNENRFLENQNGLNTAPVAFSNPAKQESSKAATIEEKWDKSLRTQEPTWIRGIPSSCIDSWTIPKPPRDKVYQYRVVEGNINLGIRSMYTDPGGSQTVNLRLYNRGYGIHESRTIEVHAVDPDDRAQTLVAKWDGVEESTKNSPQDNSDRSRAGVRVLNAAFNSDMDPESPTSLQHHSSPRRIAISPPIPPSIRRARSNSSTSPRLSDVSVSLIIPPSSISTQSSYSISLADTQRNFYAVVPLLSPYLQSRTLLSLMSISPKCRDKLAWKAFESHLRSNSWDFDALARRVQSRKDHKSRVWLSLAKSAIRRDQIVSLYNSLPKQTTVKLPYLDKRGKKSVERLLLVLLDIVTEHDKYNFTKLESLTKLKNLSFIRFVAHIPAYNWKLRYIKMFVIAAFIHGQTSYLKNDDDLSVLTETLSFEDDLTATHANFIYTLGCFAEIQPSLYPIASVDYDPPHISLSHGYGAKLPGVRQAIDRFKTSRLTLRGFYRKVTGETSPMNIDVEPQGHARKLSLPFLDRSIITMNATVSDNNSSWKMEGSINQDTGIGILKSDVTYKLSVIPWGVVGEKVHIKSSGRHLGYFVLHWA